ncbi:putative dTDP-4-dehydrorhamnose reductase [Methylobacterium phyllosphaerae]|uniref:dTDP-4-dehydrorhamnose reductase n=1 Tax=Methylobacterium phyllosphaerae TaxID=418223 RepID=A0AAE8HT80_9HYPH|nr:dTDP-4-dehydrorhamnose reductase [Methylobacterium phyllosphaerae]APT31284.1 putative dTDP-4-dehydrorhamnose reductase [Methylobacterium phyllosphaerae]SFH10612.1 dTDP-4-dehydrorhamnose reductase [Methylobacterium phyllosphaerae]
MDILVLGGAGQVGTELQALSWPDGVRVHAPGRADLDITDADAVGAALAARDYRAVINTAAYTAVDKAESDVVAAWRLNALAPAILAAATAARSIPLVHVSTDYVFAGTKPDGAYAPDAPIDPQSVYGASKAAGELAVRTGNPRHAVVRTAWVVSPHRGNFVKTMLRLAAERDALTVVDDQHGCPTSATDLAAALATIAQRMAGDADAPTGTFHCVNAGDTTWCGFAEAIVAGSARRGGRSVPVKGIPTSAYPTPARRPANSRLSTDSLTAAYGIAPRAWQAALDDILDRLVGPVSEGVSKP